ncbi:hypothetical protein THMIRHAS_10800 [Thiosulfatimonas sediminis]|uniref:DUF3579 domain-containing protein n=1 Tax=Thiosulfatimonas sediminis TaxID=2675054 RepID=A0A6F8PUK3_9GAMM|nr:DUF3579 domain-containing protein [Thiosulfatimonas sediminis]BBP45707.1 hypothetical protein THMIRHAS_10800 [Thiosulfatimonas sediminis]
MLKSPTILENAYGQRRVHCKYIIQGMTEDGRKFRPSDWIDRISSMGASFGDSHRLVYSDLLHPELFEGQKCLMIDTELEIKNPNMFSYVMNFVKSNGLVMLQVCQNDEGVWSTISSKDKDADK